MPEVCEVALTAEILDHYLKNKKIIEIEIVGGKYTRKSFPGYDDFRSSKVKSVNSKGKFMYFVLKNGYILNTFGLTGLWSFIEPDYAKIKLKTEVGDLWFSDMRNFGNICFTTDKTILDKKLDSLHPDLLKDDFEISDLGKRKIIVILMDQEKGIGSGIGNYLAVEILYRAKISPHRTGDSLTKKEIKSLVYWIKYITKLCYFNNDTGYMREINKKYKKYKPKYNYHPEIDIGNDTFEFLVYRQKKVPSTNYKVIADKIIKGRTTYWCPDIQK